MAEDFLHFDQTAGTRVAEEILESHAARCREFFVNPHGTSRQAEHCRRALLKAENSLLSLLGIERNEASVIWTSGGTEALNLACLHCSSVVVDGGAHSAMLEPCRQAERCRVLRLDKAGNVCWEEVSPATTLAAFCQVNNETGAIQDLQAIRGELARRCPQALLVVDAVQAFGKIEIPWSSAQIDLLALSAHKLGGPAGVGALVCRQGCLPEALFHGGGQQGGVRPGTVDTVGVLEFVQAAEIACGQQERNFQRVSQLNACLREMLASWEGPGIRVVSPANASPYIFSFSLPGYEAAVLMRLLAERCNILVGTGSACHAESAESSHVLRAMGFDDSLARGTLRVSLAPTHCDADIARFAKSLAQVIRDY